MSFELRANGRRVEGRDLGQMMQREFERFVQKGFREEGSCKVHPDFHLSEDQVRQAMRGYAEFPVCCEQFGKG
jgi:hypothetical protein